MTNATRSLASFSVCTTMALLASPAFAHDGPHQMTYLQSLLHELAYADALSTVLSIAAFGSVAAWRLSRRKALRAKR